ncbi:MULTISPECIES: SgcJ/EcaC family oxidoreductase [Bradyrhizobium]|uniref:SgcJ/EcaC family oxidoreductase n=1 Tax=Bradyrhizobium TaxID=374 RepID=UPI001B8A6848|nr:MULTISPECIES: SgcJ/EcaC family oxidoreductase [Bradyrhizobium]MBR0971418.1 SgcJ/EcaC family oxidoreductase [Bradyrhizobium japonicum]
MQRLFAIFLIVVGFSLPQLAKAGPNEDAAAVRAQWEQVYNSGDADKFVALYTSEATLFGSVAQLFSGSAGVRAYFSKLPPGIQVKMGDQQAVAVVPDVLLSSGFANFILKDGTVVPYRLTLAMVKVDGRWLIAQHHGSPVPK